MTKEQEKICKALVERFSLSGFHDQEILKPWIADADGFHKIPKDFVMVEFEGPEKELSNLKTWVLSVKQDKPKHEFEVHMLPGKDTFAVKIGLDLYKDWDAILKASRESYISSVPSINKLPDFDEFFDDVMKDEKALDDTWFDDSEYMYSNYVYEDTSTLMLDHMQSPNCLAYESGEEFERLKTRRENYKQFKREHGFDPSETWAFDTNIAKFVYPRLVHFKKDLKCIPMGMTEDQWREILGKIILAMRVLAIGTDDDYNQYYDKVKEGCMLFGKHLLDLNC